LVTKTNVNMNNYTCISMTDHLQIADMILKLRVFKPFFIRVVGNDNEFEYNFLIIGSYLNIATNQRTILKQINIQFPSGYIIEILNRL